MVRFGGLAASTIVASVQGGKAESWWKSGAAIASLQGFAYARHRQILTFSPTKHAPLRWRGHARPPWTSLMLSLPVKRPRLRPKQFGGARIDRLA